MLERRGLIAGMAASMSALAWAAGAAGVGERALQTFRSGLKGRLILPGEAGYDGARRGASFGPAEDRHPAMIAQCADDADVARAIDFATHAALPLAVKSGGHDVLAECVVDRGLVIDLSPMRSIAIDPAARTARVESGVRSGVFAASGKPHGLAPVLGCNPLVGVAGLTLGGGLGWLLGTRGAACDNLLGVEMITAGGRRVTANADQNPDLYWGVRGGGGNFGVVTAFHCRLHPLDKVLAGALGFRTDLTRFLRFYRDFMAEAPDELAVELSISAGRPPTIVVLFCWAGEIEAGMRILQRLRAFDTPVFDRVGPVSYADFAAFGGGAPLGNLFWRGASLDALSEGAVDGLAAAVEAGPPGLTLGVGHVMHGRICAIPDDATPLVRRPGQLNYFLGAGWRTPAEAEPAIAWVRSSMAALRPRSSQAAYINYLSDDSEAAVRAAYGARNYARLRRLKQRYDPTNVFRLNRNIRP